VLFTRAPESATTWRTKFRKHIDAPVQVRFVVDAAEVHSIGDMARDTVVAGAPRQPHSDRTAAVYPAHVLTPNGSGSESRRLGHGAKAALAVGMAAADSSRARTRDEPRRMGARVRDKNGKK